MKTPFLNRSRSSRSLASNSLSLILVTFSVVGLADSLSAATQYWDPGLTPTANGGKGSGGNGIWTSAGANWSDGSVDSALVATNIAGFAGASGTVTLTTAVSAAGLQFETNNYVIGDGTTTGQISITSQTASPSGITGVIGTSINVGSVKLGSQASGTSILLTNTDLVNFNNTTIYLTGSRGNKISNSSSGATTSYANFAVSDKPTGGTWPNTNTQLDAGNLTITKLAAAANANGTLSTYTSATAVNATFSGIGSGTFTLNGNNTLFNNVGVGGSLSLTFSMANGTLALGHDNALGARNASNALTTTSLILTSGTIAASGGARNIENAVTLGGNASVGGNNAITFAGTFTNNGGNRIVTVNNSALTTLSGPVYLANDDVTARTMTIGGTGNVTISGAITNNASTHLLASSLTKSGSGALTLSGTNTYTGNTTVNSGSSLTLATAGSLKFVIGAVGVNNKITGAGSATLNGTFNIDVSGAGTPASGSVWNLVETGKTFGASFALTGFTETPANSGLWVNGSWYFSELSGKLSYGTPPDHFWDGDSGGAWSVGGNWTSGNAPVSSDTLVFTGSNTTNNNDLSTDTLGTVALGGIIFGPGASSFNLAGNTVNLAGKTITNYSPDSQAIALNIEADTGFTVDTSAGTISLTGSLNTTSGFNKPLNKNGTGTLVLNGTQNTSWAFNVNAGTLQVFNTVAPAFSATIAPGATLKLENGDNFHFSLDLVNNGTLDVSGSGEAFGTLSGGGVVTNHGSSSAVTCLLDLGGGANATFSGIIQNGPSGARTALKWNGAGNIQTLTGANTYSGNTEVVNGTLSLSSAYLADDSAIVIHFSDNGAVLNLTHGNTDVVASLDLGSGPLAAGIYNAGNTGGAITGTGSIQVVSSAPGNYASWATANGISGQPASGDFDNDGLSNLVEYALGKNPTTSSTPAGTFTSGTVTYTKGADAIANGDVSWVIEESTNLSSWTPVVTQAAGNASTTISYTLPTGQSKVFTRLKVVN